VPLPVKQVLKACRPLSLVLALISGLLTTLWVSPVRATGDTMHYGGKIVSRLTATGGGGLGIFGSNNGTRLYPYTYQSNFEVFKVADGGSESLSLSRHYALSADLSKAYFFVDGGFRELDTNTGETQFNQISDTDYPQTFSNVLAADVGTFTSGSGSYPAIVYLDGGNAGTSREARIGVINLTDMSVEPNVTFTDLNFRSSDASRYVTDAATIALDPKGFIYLSWDYGSNGGDVYKISTTNWGQVIGAVTSNGQTMKAQRLRFGHVTGPNGTEDLLYGLSGTMAYVVDTADNDDVGNLLVEESGRSLFDFAEADNGDVYLAGRESGGAYSNIIQLTRTDNYAVSRFEIPQYSLAMGITYQKDTAGNECVYYYDNQNYVHNIRLNNSKCGIFRESRFSADHQLLAINGTLTVNVDKSWVAGAGEDAEWETYAVFQNGVVVGEPTNSIPSSIAFAWADYADGTQVVIRAYTTGSRDSTAIEEIDARTRYVDEFTFDVDYLTLGASDVSVGVSHACAIVDDSVYCWGSGSSGEIGNDQFDDVALPTKVVVGDDGFTNSNVSEVVTGVSVSCALESGSVYCWGYGDDGSLGDGNWSTSAIPLKVVPANGFENSNVTEIDLNYEHVCALESGSVYCWGYNSYGQLGVGTTDYEGLPVLVSAVDGVFANTNVTDIATGDEHTCAIESGSVFCWGSNEHGEIGDGGSSSSEVAVRVADTPPTDGNFVNANVTSVEAGWAKTCALKGGVSYCWGTGASGQLGNGDEVDSPYPLKVSNNSGFSNSAVSQLGSGYSHTCAIESGRVYCWGEGSSGELGIGTRTSESKPKAAIANSPYFANTNVTEVSAGEYTTCVIASGGVYCSGEGSTGELGNGQMNVDSVVFDRVFGSANPCFSCGGDAGIAGVTETDSNFYETVLPTEVAKMSAVKVLRPAARVTKRLLSATKGVCLVARGRILFLAAGRCRVSVLERDSGTVIRTLRTRVSTKTVDEVGVGSKALRAKTVLFNWSTKAPRDMSDSQWRALKRRVTRTGLVIIVSHTRIGNGPTTTKAFSRERGFVVKEKLSKAGTKVAVRAMGKRFPLTREPSRSAQLRNERAVIYMVPTLRPAG
jgi:alpha-tubulin suppressor-like RCC1 family protein